MNRATIGELSSPRQWPILARDRLVSDGIPVYGANGVIGYAEVSTHENPTIAIACRGTCGVVNLTEGLAYINGNAMALDNLDVSRVDVRYLARFLTWRGLLDVTTGSSQPQITRQNIVRVEVPLPPLPEQRRIASILDEVDALRAARRTAIGRNRSVMARALDDLVGSSDSIEFGGLVEEFRYGTSAKSGPTGLPVLRIPNVSRRVLDLSDLKYVELPQAEVDRLVLRSGDLLIVRTNGNPDLVGATALFEIEDQRPYVYASYLIRARPTRFVDPTFLVSYLASQSGRAALRAGARTSAGQYNINTKALAAIEVPIPALSAQRDFAQKVHHSERTTALMHTHLAKLEELFASLQHRAFRGEL